MIKRLFKRLFSPTDTENKLQAYWDDIENSVGQLDRIKEGVSSLKQAESRFVKIDADELDKEIEQVNKIVANYKQVLGSFKASAGAITEHFQVASRNSLIVSVFITIMAALAPLYFSNSLSKKSQGPSDAVAEIKVNDNEASAENGSNVGNLVDISREELSEFLEIAAEAGDNDALDAINNYMPGATEIDYQLLADVEIIYNEMYQMHQPDSLRSSFLELGKRIIEINTEKSKVDKVTKDRVDLARIVYKIKTEDYASAERQILSARDVASEGFQGDLYYLEGIINKQKNDYSSSLSSYRNAIDLAVSDKSYTDINSGLGLSDQDLEEEIEAIQQFVLLKESKILIYNATGKNKLAASYKQTFVDHSFDEKNIETKTWLYDNWLKTTVFYFEDSKVNAARLIAHDELLFSRKLLVQNAQTAQSETVKKISNKDFVIILGTDIVAGQ